MSIDVLQEKIRKLKCSIVLDLSLQPEHIPPQMQRDSLAESTDAYVRTLLDGLKGVVPAVRFSFDQFAMMGPEGLMYLSERLQQARKLGYYVLLDGPAVITPWAAQRATALLKTDSRFPCDGLIVCPYIGSDGVQPFLEYCKSGKTLFLLARTANRSAAELQDLIAGSRLVHMVAADIASRHGDTVLGKFGYSQIAVLTSATSASAVSGLRSKYKRSFLLIDGLDYPGGNGKNASFGFDRLGHGCALSVGPGITAAWKDAPAQEDVLQPAMQAVERIRSNMNRYISIL